MNDQGSAAVEAVLLAPIIVAVMCFVIFLGRVSDARAEVGELAKLGARAASIARSPDQAVDDANRVVADTAAHSRLCPTPVVSVEESRFVPGGSVTVTVSCAVDLARLTPLSLPDTVLTVTGAQTSVIDTHRTRP